MDYDPFLRSRREPLYISWWGWLDCFPRQKNEQVG